MRLPVITLFVVLSLTLVGFWLNRGANKALHEEFRSRVITHAVGPAGSCEGNPLGAGEKRALPQFPYKCGWNYVSSGGGIDVFAYTMPSGQLGWSNCALIVDTNEQQSILIDVFQDVSNTEEMLEGVKNITQKAPIKRVLITHPDFDHFFGTAAIPKPIPIYSSQVVADVVLHANQTKMNQQLFSFAILGSVVSGMLNVIKDIPVVGEHVQPLLKKLIDAIPLKGSTFGRGMAFSFAYLTPFKMSSVDHVRPVDVLLEDVDWKIHGAKLSLVNFRAHSKDDTAVLIPSAGVAIAGDLLFQGVYPLIKYGSTADIIEALDALLADHRIKVFVPGHGPITDRAGVEREKRLWLALQASAKTCFENDEKVDDCVKRFQADAQEKFEERDCEVMLEISYLTDIATLKGERPSEQIFMDRFGKHILSKL
ncbi:hypothetical protein NDN08_003446 [Rhodosorus marinus]|uniref:Metallo-beta-lactamase domain-containing protein n=1 Tax=Rhodosorus marinus TaxID=101924 RepID=A0AAV8UWI7_9RHOD|nr:hypothetical protein NDN08_003446 [Rhodosorus marinus]